MTYPIIIDGKNWPTITQANVKIRIECAPFDARGFNGRYRTVRACWSLAKHEWFSIPSNSAQAIYIAELIDSGQIKLQEGESHEETSPGR